MSKTLKKIRGEEALDDTLTIKISGADKEYLIQFAKENRVSMGKLVREGISLIMGVLEDELNAQNKNEKTI